jgi:hypothetical protein
MNVICTDYLGAKVYYNFNIMGFKVCHIIHGSKVLVGSDAYVMHCRVETMNTFYEKQGFNIIKDWVVENHN